MNWTLLKNSLLVAGLATLAAACLGFTAALWLAGLERPWRNRLLALALVALALPPFLVTNCWLHFLGLAGVWRGWLPLNILSLGGAVWILSLLMWPITLLMVLGAWQRLEPSQLESDSALRGWWLIRGLLWPVARTALGQAAVLTFVLALNNFAVPAILQVKVFPAEMWVRFNTTFDTAGALQLSWPLVVAPLLLLLWFARRELPWPRTQGRISARLFRLQVGLAFFWFAGAVTTLLCALAVGLPLLQLILVKRTWTELPGALAAGQTAAGNSLCFAAVSGTLVVLLGLVLGTHQARSTPSLGSRDPCPSHGAAGLSTSRVPSSFGFRTLDLFRWLSWLFFLLPGVLLGIGLIVAFNRPWSSLLYQSAGIVILAFVLRYLALGWNGMAHALEATDRDLTDVARLGGASRWQIFRFVQWPQVAPQAAALWYIVFLLCLWDVESMVLVVPPGGETLALRVFNLLHYGHNAQVNALCLTLLALALAPLAGWRVWCLIQGSRPAFKHYAIRVLFVTVFALAPLFGGCSPGASSSQAPLQSRLFQGVQIIGLRGVGVGEFNKPRSVAVDKQDNLYVVDMTGRVQKFSSNGVFLLSWQMPQTDLGKPKGMGHDRDGNVLVVEPHYQRVNVFSPEGKLAAQWGKRGTNAGEFILPRAVAVNSRGEVFVSEYGVVERVQRFAPRGERLLNSFGHPGNGPGEFNRAEGLGMDSKDRLYVADSCNHRIQVFSSDGQFLRAYGKAGKGTGDLSYPYDVCVDGNGRQYVCEFGNSRIQVFDANDTPIEVIGGAGSEPGKFSNPWGVALDSAGNLYVADSQNHRVQKLIRRQSIASNQRAVATNLRRAGRAVTRAYGLRTTSQLQG
jgi:ABC-type Fe3+ transport system permease subunit/DNA-binding beta-propeller fold protein YncE